MAQSHFTREPIDVADELARDELVSRIKKIRAAALLDKNTIEHWNRTHSNEPPIGTAFEDAIIAWCDGEGPLPRGVAA